ncbi:MAG: Trp biosynthesis-associated membrane protein [Blastococcus sp.]
MNARRELTTAVLAAVVAGALALSAAGQSWATVTLERAAPLPPVDGVLTGSDAAPLVPAAGLVLLAGAVALLALHGAARTVVGLLMAIAGGVLGWSGVRALTGGLADESIDLPFVGRGTGPVTVDVSAVGPSLGIVAGLLGVAAGVLVVLRSRGWPAMGRRYERTPAVAGDAVRGAPTRPQTDEDRAQAAWRAMDRGEDPTDLPPDDGRP